MYKFIIFLSVFALSFSSCQKDREESELGSGSPHEIAAKINYQMTQTQVNQVMEGAASSLSLRESALLQTSTRKTDVSIVLKKDGSAKWIIQEIPTEPLVEHKNLADTRAKRVKTIIENGQVTQIDATGKNMQSMDVDMKPFDEMLANIVGRKGKSAAALSVGTGNPNTANANLRDGRYLTQIQYDAAGDKNEVTIDTELNIAVRSSVKDPNGKLKDQTLYDFDTNDLNQDGIPRLKRIISFKKIKAPVSQIDVIQQLITEIGNLTIEDFLNGGN